jgi:hypothetical protein
MGIDKKIIYPNDEGGVSIIFGSPEWFSIPGNTIEKLAQKDVPAGKPFKIVNAYDIPSDRTFRNAWEVEITTPDGFGIGHDVWYNKS